LNLLIKLASKFLGNATLTSLTYILGASSNLLHTSNETSSHRVNNPMTLCYSYSLFSVISVDSLHSKPDALLLDVAVN